jgi:hypothetical protein
MAFLLLLSVILVNLFYQGKKSLSHGKLSINLPDYVNLQNVENSTKTSVDIAFFEKAKNSPILKV